MKIKLFIAIQTVLSISLLVNLLLLSANSKHKKQITILNETIIASQDTLHYWKDKNGKLYSEKEVLVVNYNKIKISNDKLISTVEEQRKQLKVKPNTIQYVNVETVKLDTILKTIVVDSCYTYNDNWNTFKFCKDMQNINIVDTTNTILYTQKYIQNPSKLFFIRWFQKKETKYNLNITHSNPLLKTTDLKTIVNTKNK